MTLEGGRTVTPREVLEDPIPGRKVCILGDCSSPLPGLQGACQGADLLVHEATLGDQQREKAVERGHSTPGMAAEVARSCGVRRLVLYHFSQRFKPLATTGEEGGYG